MEESGSYVHVMNFSDTIRDNNLGQSGELQGDSLSSPDEAALWQNFKSGNKQAFSRIYHLYFNTLYNYGRKISHDKEFVKDCVQDLFYEIWERRNFLSDTTSIKFYLLKALRIKLLKELNKKTKTDNCEILDHYPFHIEFSYEAELIASQLSLEQKNKLNRSLEALSKRQKEVIFLRYFNNLSCEEIASILSMNHQSVHNLIHRAIKALRENLIPLVAFVWLLSSW